MGLNGPQFQLSQPSEDCDVPPGGQGQEERTQLPGEGQCGTVRTVALVRRPAFRSLICLWPSSQGKPLPLAEASSIIREMGWMFASAWVKNLSECYEKKRKLFVTLKKKKGLIIYWWEWASEEQASYILSPLELWYFQWLCLQSSPITGLRGCQRPELEPVNSL